MADITFVPTASGFRFASQAEAKMACFSFIEGWYNPARLHSALGYRSPMAYEAARDVAIAEPNLSQNT